MIKKMTKRFIRASLDIRLFLVSVAIIGFSGNIIDSTFNNFLSETYKIGGLGRSALELPRELPGFFVVFVTALLFFLPGRRLGAFAMLMQAMGLFLIAFFHSSFPVMLIWLFLISLGQHLFIPLQSSIGMELAHEGKEGRRLGQLNSARAIASIAGSFVVFIGFKYLHFNFTISFVIAGVWLIVAAICFVFMTPMPTQHPLLHLKLYKEYRLFYWLNILYGTRKQIFITFAPWVIVTVFNKPTEVVAFLFTIGGIASIFFQPVLGHMVDRLGERFVLAMEALVLIVICLGYGFSRKIFQTGDTAFIIASACYVIDMLLISVGMARATYLKKIAVNPAHVASTLSMGVTIDHVFSISIALASGVIWYKLGYQYVFLLASIIAVVNFFSALQIRVPKKIEI